MPSRAERRRAEREAAKGDWVPFQPPSVAERLVKHTQSCPECQSGTVVGKGCRWLTEFYGKHTDELNRMLGAVQFYDEETGALYKGDEVPLANAE